MNLNTLKAIRHQVYGCFERGADALLELADALPSEAGVRSLPQWSLSPAFRRKWPSLYEALEDGQINQRRWSEVWTAALLPEQHGPIWISVDSTSIARPEAETSPDRGMIYVPNLPHAKRPVSVGWQFSTVMLLPATRSSWYATGPCVAACQRLQMPALVRLKRNRKLYRQAPPPIVGKRGAPRKDGELFQGSKPETWGEADASWHGSDEQGQPIGVQAWQHLHFRQARDVELTVYRVLRPAAKGSRRDPRESWFVWVEAGSLPLEEVVACYQHRFSHEHTYRFLKQDLLWTKVHVRTPQQFERWSLLVATAQNQLVLARSFGQASYRPWERRRQVVTPRQVRRVMPAILQQLGTPAGVPKPRGKSPGWPKGTPRRRPTRFEVIKKPKPEPQRSRKRA